MSKNTAVDISVIVPIYNVEDYLEECLDSLLVQGEPSLEVIMVDDGSTDSSGAIADRYADQYEGFICHHIPNGGLGHARNYGAGLANGKYICFLDSDDKIVPYTYQTAFRAAERDQSDLAVFHVCRFNSNKTWNSQLHERAFRDLSTPCHISNNANLLNDTTS